MPATNPFLRTDVTIKIAPEESKEHLIGCVATHWPITKSDADRDILDDLFRSGWEDLDIKWEEKLFMVGGSAGQLHYHNSHQHF